MAIDLLNYPFDNPLILRKRKAIRKELMQKNYSKKIKVAVLGGSTTHELVNVLELFLLKKGISPSFYESDYNKYYEDALFGNDSLLSFQPDIIYIHTTHKNISEFPSFDLSLQSIEQLLDNEMVKFRSIWKSLEFYNCPIIQNNFDLPLNKNLGNLDCYEIHGRTLFLNRLNLMFAYEAQANKNLFLNDINYLSASIGLKNWFDKNLWFTAKYAVSFDAIPTLANNITNIISAILGMSKKCLVLDLDNTCWGGVIGDDGLNGIDLGKETPSGEAYQAFQAYIKELKDRGIILAVCSKNEFQNAKEGFTHSDSILKYSDFTSFYANWAPKHLNIEKIAQEINIDINSLVFIDDNAVERSLVESQLPEVAVPDVGDNVLDYIDYLEQNGYFSLVSLSDDDINRSKFYSGNLDRAKEQTTFNNYDDFLSSLLMKAEIRGFSSEYFERITQLINKTNQFNLTTNRYDVADVTSMSKDDGFITLFGKLSDKFGDNGLISIIIAKVDGDRCIIDTFLMSCRVLKRSMEFAMLDVLIDECKKRNLTQIYGQFKRTAKNNMVANLYGDMGFDLIERSDTGDLWKLSINNITRKELKIKIN